MGTADRRDEPPRGAQPAGVALGLWQDREPLEALATARLADRHGYAELWVGEMATFDAVALATAIGAATSRIALTLGPLAPSVRDPVAIALGAASVRALTGRATNVALGASSPVVVRRWHGREFGGTLPQLRDATAELRSLFGGGRSSGGYRLRLPSPGASITIAAFGPATVRLAGRVADRMVVNLCTPEATAELRAQLDLACERAGRAPITLAAWIPAAVEPTSEGLAQIRRGLVAYLGAPGYAAMFRAAGGTDVVAIAERGAPPAEVLARIPDGLVEAVSVTGDIASCRRRLAAYAAAGVDEVVLVPVTAGDDGGERTLEALAPRAPVPGPGVRPSPDTSGGSR